MQFVEDGPSNFISSLNTSVTLNCVTRRPLGGNWSVWWSFGTKRIDGAQTCENGGTNWIVLGEVDTETVEMLNYTKWNVSLTICKLTKELEGDYTCHAKDNDVTIIKSFAVTSPPVVSQPTPKEDSSEVAIPIVIVVVLIGIITVATVIIVIYICRKRKGLVSYPVEIGGDTAEEEKEAVDKPSLGHFLDIPEHWYYRGVLTIEKELGSGQFGSVHLAHTPGILSDKLDRHLVAVKKTKGKRTHPLSSHTSQPLCLCICQVCTTT